MSGRPLLELRDLRKRFPDRRGRRGEGSVEAVAGVSLSVARAETVALVGESGSGKTTTGLCALRLLEPDGGAVLFDGEDVLAMDRRRLRRFRRRAQIVFQDTGAALNPRRSAGAALEEVLRVHRLGSGGRAGRRRRAGELLELVGLRPEDARRFPHEMSGGERQRLGIARSLAVEPELLVLDEPVAALDASVQATVMNLLLSLREEMGLAYLLIAHDLSLVESLADRVAVMLEGRIVEEGPSGEVLGTPRHPYTRGLLQAIPSLPDGPPGGPTGRLMGP